MNYSQIICKDANKELKADKIYKIQADETSLENIVSVCYNCPYSNSNVSPCKNCYGTIAQNSIRIIRDKPGVKKIDIKNYRNTFHQIQDEYIEELSADNFIDSIDIIANLTANNWNHGQKVSDRLIATDRPKTWKTDCLNCKLKCSQKGVKTACEKAKEYCENKGINLSTVSSSKIAEINLPEDCICTQQTQFCIEV